MKKSTKTLLALLLTAALLTLPAMAVDIVVTVGGGIGKILNKPTPIDASPKLTLVEGTYDGFVIITDGSYDGLVIKADSLVIGTDSTAPQIETRLTPGNEQNNSPSTPEINTDVQQSEDDSSNLTPEFSPLDTTLNEPQEREPLNLRQNIRKGISNTGGIESVLAAIRQAANPSLLSREATSLPLANKVSFQESQKKGNEPDFSRSSYEKPIDWMTSNDFVSTGFKFHIGSTRLTVLTEQATANDKI